MALACAYLLIIQASIAQDARLAWAGAGFAMLLVVDLGRSLAAENADLTRGLSLMLACRVACRRRSR